MNINIFIDEFTPCLKARNTGDILDTEIRPCIPDFQKLKKAGWFFDWSLTQKKGFDVYALTLKGDKEIQGLISLQKEPYNQAVHIDIVETAPHNFGSKGKYIGVGGHLFAFAGNLSMESGYDCIYFEAKTDLIDYYTSRLGAKQIGNSQLMILEGEELSKLVKEYYKEG